MAESTLNAAFKDLQGDIGFFLGFGRGADNGDNTWDAYQQASIDRCTKGGLRNFYFCNFQWSFLKPVTSLTLLNGTRSVPLPDDFGGVEGMIALSGASTIVWMPLSFVGIGMVDQMQAQLPTTTGRPRMVAVEPLKGTGPQQGQRYQMRFWPISDSDYTLRFQYYLNPDYLTGALPFAYGGPEHAETMLESCLAVAEKILDDQADVHEREFMKRLEMSKVMDARKKPQLIGYNRDMSDMKWGRWSQWNNPWPHGWSPITVGGTQY